MTCAQKGSTSKYTPFQAFGPFQHMDPKWVAWGQTMGLDPRGSISMHAPHIGAHGPNGLKGPYGAYGAYIYMYVYAPYRGCVHTTLLL